MYLPNCSSLLNAFLFMNLKNTCVVLVWTKNTLSKLSELYKTCEKYEQEWITDDNIFIYTLLKVRREVNSHILLVARTNRTNKRKIGHVCADINHFSAFLHVASTYKSFFCAGILVEIQHTFMFLFGNMRTCASILIIKALSLSTKINEEHHPSTCVGL